MIYLHGIGHFHPPNIIDNRFLEDLDIGTTAEWIRTRVGIESRHTALPLEYIRHTRNRQPAEGASCVSHRASDMAFAACTLALARSGIDPSNIGMVICGSSAPEYGSPAMASVVAERLSIKAIAFDVSSACTSFASQLFLLWNSTAEYIPPFILAVQVENLTRSVDYSDKKAAVLMGDAATAVLLSRAVPSQVAIDHVCFGTDPQAWRTVTIPFGGFLAQDGKAVQHFAVRRMHALASELLAPGDTFVGHQANLTMLRSVCCRLGVDECLHAYNVDRRGNCGAAGAPSVLSEQWDTWLGADKTIVVALVGAGLSWGSVRLRFRRTHLNNA